MELRIPTHEQLRIVYQRDLKAAFPAAELKSLAAMERMWREGLYAPHCLFDGERIVGEAFLWLGHPGWALLDHLCVASDARNGGIGAMILRSLLETEPETVFFGEVEAPVHAPDPAMAERRLGFYTRNGLRVAGYDTEIFGVHYQTLYLANRPVADGELMAEHQYVYQRVFTPEKYQKYVKIPRDPHAAPGRQVAWEQ